MKTSSRRPKLLDLYCGDGGASVGYDRAGFEVVGVDIEDHPRYPFEFHRADAMTFPLEGVDVIHASPMWLAHTWQRNGRTEDTVTPIYERLRACGKPWVCESGSHGPLKDVALFCGPAFGLRVIRHMYFASSELLMTPGCQHVRGGCKTGLYYALDGSYHKNRDAITRQNRRAYRDAAGVGWMSARAADLAVPPAYTEFIGAQLLLALKKAA